MRAMGPTVYTLFIDCCRPSLRGGEAYLVDGIIVVASDWQRQLCSTADTGLF